MANRQVIAIVPARHYSQRVPGKNYRNLGGQPLYRYIINTLLNTEFVSHIVVDTDSSIIKRGLQEEHDIRSNFIVLDRPAELCEPKISMNQIISSILERLSEPNSPIKLTEDTIILQSHVTNPFLSSVTINNAIQTYLENPTIDTLLTVTKFQRRLWMPDGQAVNHDPSRLLQTQDLMELYEENSCLYLFTIKTFKEFQNRLGMIKIFFPMDHLEAWDIDTESDFRIAEALIQNQSLLMKDQKINMNLFNLLRTELKDEITYYQKNPLLKSPRILISAPYMMPEIETFRHFYQHELKIETQVAKVNERLSEQDLEQYQDQYEIAICGDDAFTKKILTNSKTLYAICKWGTGIDSIDQEAAKEQGILIYNTPDAFSVPVAQSMLSAILNFARQTQNSNQIMKHTDQWVKLPSKTIEEMTIGIIGLGNVGRTLANYLTTFNPQSLLGYDIIESINNLPNSVTRTTLPLLLAQSDMVCLCCTLTPSSYHLINEGTLLMMKPNSYVINMARGKLVDEEDLIEALTTHHLAGAALDIFEEEPLSEDSPLRVLPNVLISSHNANSSAKYWNKVHVNTIRNSLKAIREYNQLKIGI